MKLNKERLLSGETITFINESDMIEIGCSKGLFWVEFNAKRVKSSRLFHVIDKFVSFRVEFHKMEEEIKLS